MIKSSIISALFFFVALISFWETEVTVFVDVGPDNLANLKKIAEQYQRREATIAEEGDGDDDDDIPELVEGETFEEAAKDSNP